MIYRIGVSLGIFISVAEEFYSDIKSGFIDGFLAQKRSLEEFDEIFNMEEDEEEL